MFYLEIALSLWTCEAHMKINSASTVEMVRSEKSTGGKSSLTARNMWERVVAVEMPRKHPRALPSSNGHLSPALMFNPIWKLTLVEADKVCCFPIVYDQIPKHKVGPEGIWEIEKTYRSSKGGTKVLRSQHLLTWPFYQSLPCLHPLPGELVKC